MKYKLDIERGGREGEEKKENVRTSIGRKVFQEKKKGGLSTVLNAAKRSSSIKPEILTSSLAAWKLWVIMVG